ncbi:MAG: HAMP domain-containing sensor histidine kinase [Eubacteriales bacterium]|nr:HAMP domain-containing sensor histidine kinase [Eubacteriales bacterium]
MKLFKRTKTKMLKTKVFRKPKYKNEFYKILTILMVVIIPLEMIVTCLAADSYKNRAYKQLDIRTERVTDDILKAEENYGDIDFTKVEEKDGKVTSNADTPEERDIMNQEMARLQYRLETCFDWQYDTFNNILDGYNGIKYYGEAGYRDLSSYCELYNTDGVKIACDDNACTWIVSFREKENEERKPTRFYWLDTNQVEKIYPDFWNIVNERTNYKKNNHHDVRIVFDEVYVKDGYVLPKYIYLKDTRDYDTGEYIEENEQEILETFDLSACDFSGYALYEVDEEIMHAFYPIWFLSRQMDVRDRHYQYSQNVSEDELIKEIKSLKDRTDTTYYCFEESNIDNEFKTKIVEMKKIINSDLVCVVSYDYDFFRDWKGVLAIFYGGSFVLAVLVSLIISAILYIRKKHVYGKYVYRRDMTNAMAHDLKSPLMAISGYAENLNMFLKEDKDKYYVERILETVGDMNQMIANILDLSKLEEAERGMKRENVALEQIVQEQLAKYKERMKERELTVAVMGEAQIKADVEWMGHLVDNLLSNAAKYAKPNSEIQIQISEKEFVITNAYEGEMDLAPEQLLEPFSKGDNARNNTEGNGVGLSIVNRVAQTHGYKVKITIDNNQFVVIISM